MKDLCYFYKKLFIIGLTTPLVLQAATVPQVVKEQEVAKIIAEQAQFPTEIISHILQYCAESDSSVNTSVSSTHSGETLAHPPLFNQVWSHLAYFHAPDACQKLLDSVANQNLIFEIDLSWAHSSFNSYVSQGHPYIGHPEEFYTKKGQRFPASNVDILEFQAFLLTHPSIKVLIDIKDETVYPFLKWFIQTVGAKRCMVHAFIKNWTHVPPNTAISPHWYREDVDLFKLNDILAPLHVPLIANCRGFNDANVEQYHLVSQMINDSKRCTSVVSLGLYYSGVPLPKIEFLQAFHDAGYYAWVNGNIPDIEKKLGKIRHIAMTDDVKYCTRL